MKKMKKFFCMMIVFVCCLKIYAINPVYAEEISETTENSRDTGRTLAPPQEKDWTDTNVQNDVWDIFASRHGMTDYILISLLGIKESPWLMQ